MDEELLIESATSILTSTPRGLKILADAIGRKDDIETFTTDANAVKNAAQEYRPEIAIFTTKGRVYDLQTNEPIQGVNIRLISALYPMKKIEVTKTRKEVTDPNTRKKEKVEYTEVKYKYDNKGVKELKTDKNGGFELRFGVPVLPNLNNRVIVQPRILYEMDGYAPKEQTIVSGNGEVLQELPIAGLLNIDEAAKIAAEELKNEANQIIGKVSNFVLNPVERSIVVIKNAVLKSASTIQNKLFPLAIGLLILFGITKLAQANKGTEKCPNNALLKLCIQRRNSIVKQLNNIYKVIIANTALVALFLYISSQFKAGKIAVGTIGFPLAVFPYPIVSILENIKELFEKLSNINTELKKALIIALMFLIASLIIILRYLKKIDELIEKCAGDGTGGLEMTEINNELLAIGAESTAQGNPTVTNVNGFEMSVEVVPNSRVGEIYKRQAIAKNSTGITILKGEGSFSAEDQILIDELSFYIVQNNLKAD